MIDKTARSDSKVLKAMLLEVHTLLSISLLRLKRTRVCVCVDACVRVCVCGRMSDLFFNRHHFHVRYSVLMHHEDI